MSGYINVDSEGFLINSTSLDGISDDRMQILNEVISITKRIYGENLHSLYIIRDVLFSRSGLNIWSLLKNRNEDTPMTEDDIKIVDRLMRDVDYGIVSLDDIDRYQEFTLKIHSLCLSGEDIIPSIGKFSLPDIVDIGVNLDEIDDAFYDYASVGIAEDPSDKDKKDLCRWLCNNILRCAYKIVMIREKKYTTDLQLCWEGYSKYYSDTSYLLKEFLDYYNNPTTDLEMISEKWVDLKDILEEQFVERTLD